MISYTQYLKEVESGRHENVPAPQIAIDYWQLDPDARLTDVIIAVRADEAEHRDVNHAFVNAIDKRRGKPVPDGAEDDPKDLAEAYGELQNHT